jgi:hypothetical protein
LPPRDYHRPFMVLRSVGLLDLLASTPEEVEERTFSFFTLS